MWKQVSRCDQRQAAPVAVEQHVGERAGTGLGERVEDLLLVDEGPPPPLA